MGYVTTRDGVEISYRDWEPRDVQVIFFHHGWPLSTDDWDTQMLFLLDHGYRVVAHDRRGHGRSNQVWDDHDVNHYADDVATVVDHLGIQGAVHVRRPTDGSGVIHYIAHHGEDRVSKAAIISAVPPLMVQAASNPGDLPKSIFDGLQSQLKANRAQFYYNVPTEPFYGYNHPGAKPSEGIVWNWWRQGTMGCAKAHCDGIMAFSQTDFTEGLKSIKIPVLVMHGDDDQIVPYKGTEVLSVRLLRNSILKVCSSFPHGVPTANADTIDADLLAFVRS